MKQNRKKKIIIAVITAVIVTVLVILAACSQNRERKNVGYELETGTVRQADTKHVAQKEKQEKDAKTVNTPAPETSGTQAEVTQDPVTAQPSGPLPEPQQAADVTGIQQDTIPRSEPAVHVHAYTLSDTAVFKHPAVTEQIWVADAPAWDEVIRDGYHVCVVTCHECGAQFQDIAQGNALMAWGDHIDAVHDGDGGYDMAASYDVPPEILHHDASGHYETRTVSTAWTEYIDTFLCSCGDSYTRTR